MEGGYKGGRGLREKRENEQWKQEIWDEYERTCGVCERSGNVSRNGE